MQDVELAWLAGIIDGEGCLTLFHRTNKSSSGQTITSVSANLTITNSSYALVNECRRILDGLGVKYSYLTPRNSAARPIRRLQVKNYASLMTLLEAIEPYSVGKREQVLLMKDFASKAAARKGFRGTVERRDYATKMRELNHSGQLIP